MTWRLPNPPLERTGCAGRSASWRSAARGKLRARDNREHVPRVRREARAFAAGLREIGVTSREAKVFSEEIVGYAKELFLDEWMSEVERGEDEAEDEGRRGC